MKPQPWSAAEESLIEEKRKAGLTKPQVYQALITAGFQRSYQAVKCKLKYMRDNGKSPLLEELKKNPVNPIGLRADFNPPAYKNNRPLTLKFKLLLELTKVVALFDGHFPYQLILSGVFKVLDKIKPDIIILGGDWWSMDCISHHEKDTFKNKGFKNIADRFNWEKDRLKKFIAGLIERYPNAHFVYIIGNHEDWLTQFCSDFPQLEEPTIEKIFSCFGDKITIVPLGSYYKIGHMVFCHGDQWGTENPAKQAVVRSKETMIFGHHHTYKVWTDFAMADEEKKYLGIAVPCMAPKNPKYMKGRPNGWLSGFFTASVRRNGKFSPFVWMMSPKGTVIDPYGEVFD